VNAAAVVLCGVLDAVQVARAVVWVEVMVLTGMAGSLTSGWVAGEQQQQQFWQAAVLANRHTSPKGCNRSSDSSRGDKQQGPVDGNAWRH
jgi:hypothetical protein